MDRASRSALQSLNDRLTHWDLPTLIELPKVSPPWDPYSFVFYRALRARQMIDDAGPMPGLKPFRPGPYSVRWWGQGLLHVLDLTEGVSDFINAFHAGAYPALVRA